MKLLFTALLSTISFFGLSQAQYNLDWGTGFGSTMEDYMSSIILTPQNTIIISGNIAGGFDFDPGPGNVTLFTGSTMHWFVAEYDTSGAFIWAKYWDDLPTSHCHLELDNLGNIYMIGSTVTGTQDFDPGVGVYNVTSSSAGYFRIKLDPSGNFIEGSILSNIIVGGNNHVKPSSLIIDDAQQMYVAGYFEGEVDLNSGGAPLLDTGSVDGSMFLQKFDSNGGLLWANRYDNSMAYNVHIDDSSNVYLCGYFRDTVDFDPGPGQDIHSLFGVGVTSSFIQKLDSNGVVIWTNIYDDGNADSFNEIAVDSAGNVFVAGGSGISLVGALLKVVRYDAVGNMIWDKTIGNGDNFDFVHGIKLDELNNVYISGPFVGIIDMDPNPATTQILSSGTSVNGGTFLLKLSENGDYIWAHAIGQYFSTNLGARLLELDDDGNIYYGSGFNGTIDVEPGTGITNIDPIGGTDFCMMKLSPNPCSNFYVTMDSLQHGGCSTPGYAEASAYNGAGTYTYLWDNVPPSDSTSAILNNPGINTIMVTDSLGCVFESSVLVNMPTTYSGFDLNVNMVSSPLIPGHQVNLWLDAFNDGCVPQGGTVSVVFQNPTIQSITFNPLPDAVNGDTIVWNFAPATYDDPHFLIEIQGVVDTNAVLDDTVSVDVIFLPSIGDFNPVNNVKSYLLTVVNSYDPNYKSVYPAGVCPENFVLKDETLTYTIHFQNTGTSQAYDVKVRDEIDANLDLSSIRVLAQSHPMIMDVLPLNIIDFRFDDILLPDSTSNEPESHGWVVFEIDPLPNLTDYEEVSNNVGIYFDYNEPVITNTVYTTYIDVIECSVGLAENHGVEVLVYPNPTTGIITVESTQALENVSLTMISIDGRIVSQSSNLSGNQFQVDLLNQGSGMYWLIVESGISKSTYKVVLQ